MVWNGTTGRQDFLVGIQIAADECSNTGIPALFTGVGHLLDWIEGVINS